MASFGIFLMLLDSGGSFVTFEHPPITNMLNKVIVLKAQTTGLGGFEDACVSRIEPEVFDTWNICPANELD